MQNWFDTELEVDILDSPFFYPDAVLEVIETKAIFHNREAIVEIRARSRRALGAVEYERYREVELSCRLYDLDVSENSARLATEECTFTSSHLDVLQFKVPEYSLKRGSYHF